MRTTMMTLTALASLALLPTAGLAHTVKAPHPGTVTNTTYSSSGSYHGAVDISPGTSCGYWGVETGVVGSVYWDVTLHSTTTTCTSPSGNTAVHLFADGWYFRLHHFLKSPTSAAQTCDRCELGRAGNHTHLQHDKAGTLDTSWYASYTTKGEAVDRTETLGVLD